MHVPRPRIVPAWVVAGLAVGIGALVTVRFWGDQGFLQALGATYMGAVLGFLVALYVDRLQRSEDDKTRRRDDARRASDELRIRQEQERERRVAVVSLLRKELGPVPQQMLRRQGRSHPPSPFDLLADILWRSFSTSGELRWITDLGLLRTIALAYQLIEVEIELERRWRRVLGDWGTAGRDVAENHVANDLKSLDNDLWRRACDACKAMDVALLADGAEPGPESDLNCP